MRARRAFYHARSGGSSGSQTSRRAGFSRRSSRDSAHHMFAALQRMEAGKVQAIVPRRNHPAWPCLHASLRGWQRPDPPLPDSQHPCQKRLQTSGRDMPAWSTRNSSGRWPATSPGPQSNPVPAPAWFRRLALVFASTGRTAMLSASFVERTVRISTRVARWGHGTILGEL